jgi:hypothetical protein
MPILGNCHKTCFFKLSYDRRSVSWSVLVSGHHMTPTTNFSFNSTENILRNLWFSSYGAISMKRRIKWKISRPTLFCTCLSMEMWSHVYVLYCTHLISPLNRGEWSALNRGYERTTWPLVRERTTPTEQRHRSANFITTIMDRGVLCSQRGGTPTVVNISFIDRSR